MKSIAGGPLRVGSWLFRASRFFSQISSPRFYGKKKCADKILQEIPDKTLQNSFRSFEKGLADRRGWREDILPMPQRMRPHSLHLLSYGPPRRRGTCSWRIFWPVSLGLVTVCRQPPPANPFSKPLIHRAKIPDTFLQRGWAKN